MKKRKLIILSLDAMITEDLEYLKDRPLIKKMMSEGVWIKTLRTVYPANTYPCHASMITGAYPYKTGVDTNYYEGTHTWRAERENIKIKTLIDYAKEAGYTTANVFWPVLGGDSSIDYNIPEYFYNQDEFISVFKKYGTTDQVVKDIIEPNIPLLEGNGTHDGDRFIFACARDMVLKYQPDILLIHPCPLDTQRHRDGVFSDDVTKALEKSYEAIEAIYDAVKQIGEEDNTNFVLMSDHGQFTIDHWYRFMVDLVKEGLLATDEKGNITTEGIEVYAENPGVLMKVEDKELLNKILLSLKEKEKANMGIKVYNRDEFNKLFHINKDYDILVDSDGVLGVGRETYPDADGSIISSAKPGVVKKLGTHGFSPDIGYQPTLVAIGPDFKKGVTLDRVETVCVPVTLAKCLGLTMEDADGTVIEEILK